ncbi:MAG: CaiB/BaiF CoA-transferase family protein [Pseudomonadota bacterium]
MTQPLKGVTVLDLSMLLPGPLCSMMMADFGARVIKIERPGRGDLMRDYPHQYPLYSGNFATLNRNKESMTLNLKSEQGKSIFLKLIERSDVLIEGFRPGVMDRLGFGYGDLSQINGRLIYCSITGFGQESPYRDVAGHDLNYIALNGTLGLTGKEGEAPRVPSILVGDIGGGAYPAMVGILLALIGRNTTGRGQYIDISMVDCSFFWLYWAASIYFTSGRTPARGKETNNGGCARYQIYETKDGRFLAVGAIEDQFWQNLCDLLGVDDPRVRYHDMENSELAIDVLSEKFRNKTSQEWATILEGKDVLCNLVRDFKAAVSDPHFQIRGLIKSISGPDGETQTIFANPIKLSGTPSGIRHVAPVLGQNNKKILKELGYSEAECRTLIEGGTL